MSDVIQTMSKEEFWHVVKTRPRITDLNQHCAGCQKKITSVQDAVYATSPFFKDENGFFIVDFLLCKQCNERRLSFQKRMNPDAPLTEPVFPKQK